MTILNAYLLHNSCGGKMTHKKFREILVRNLIVQSHEANITVSGVSRGRPSKSGAQLSRLEVKHSQHWPSKGKQRRRLCSQNKKTRSTLFCCNKCDVGLCVVDCFKKRHTRACQSVSTEWSEKSYHKLWSDAVHTRIQSEQKFIVYTVLFYKKSACLKFQKKKLGVSPLEFQNIHNKDDILHFMTK
jgi:hypothetical protein